MFKGKTKNKNYFKNNFIEKRFPNKDIENESNLYTKNMDLESKNKWEDFKTKLKDLDELFFISGQKSATPYLSRKTIVEKTEKSHKITLPLYFGWEIVVMVRRAEDWQKHVIKPFKRYWQYITVVAVLILVSSTSFFWYLSSISKAATYYFTQTSWSGGATANTATHGTDRSGWTEYTSKDSNISAGTEVLLTESINTLTETSDVDFGAGSTSNIEISGSGDSALLELSTTSGSNGLINNAGVGEYAWDVYLEGNYAYIANGTGGLFIYDVSDPASPSYVGDVDPGAPDQVAVYGNYVYLGDSNRMDVIDASNKAAPVDIANILYSGSPSPEEIIIVGSTMYVAWSGFGCGGYCGESYIKAYDLSNPASPSETVSTITIPKFINDIYIEGNYIYASVNYYEDPSPGDLYWYDISNPSAITFVGSTPVGNEYTNGLAVSGQYVFMANGVSGVRVFSTSTDSLVHTYNTAGNAYDLALNGDHLYVADQNTSILDLDISNPLSISQNTTYTSTNAKRLSFSSPYLYVADYSAGLRTISIPSYVSSGTFTSQILDTTANNSFGNLSWSSSLPTGASISVKVRSDSSSDMSGATAWASCDTITSGSDISTNNCVTDGHRYLQYQATLATTESSRTPQLNDLSIEYNSYSNGSLLSSAFDTESSENIMGTISWTESGSGDVQLQIRTAPDSGGSPDWASGSGWCGPSNCAATTGDTDYAASYYTTSGASINSNQQAGSDDQWFQYRLWLTSADGASTPTFSDLTISYVVNAPPEFESVPTAAQIGTGIVNIAYSIRDTDSTSGSATPGYITPSFQYSLDNGDNWNNITTGLSVNATSTNAVDEVNYTSYQVTWTPSEQISAYSTQAKIRVVIDDGEAANNTASSDSVAFTLDAKAPTVGDPAVYVVATTTPAALYMNASDDSSLQSCITLDNTESNCNAYTSEATINLSTDPDTAYVIFRDAFSNTYAASAVTPETPTNMIIRDLSNTSDGDTVPEFRLFISWAAVSTPLVDFAKYEVWHSTDGSTYSLLASIADKTINYYLHDDLSENSLHYYKVYTVDNDGNTSYFSSAVSDTANGQGGTDASPPTISSVSIGSINTQSAVITWTTDELSDSTVGYSTTAGNFDSETGVATMVTDHSVTLTGLTPGTIYYLRAKSSDPDTNEATDSSGGDGYSFTTLSGPAISNTSASTVQNTKATITWNTDVAANSTVYYSTNSDMSGAMSTSDSGSVTDHSVDISGLSAGTRYYFYVQSGVAIDNNGGEYYYFNTTSDSTGPVISDVEDSIVTDDDAVITWTTDEGATSQVSYGLLTGEYSTTTTETNSYNTYHSVTITPLANNTTYYYVVTSADSAGNYTTSTESTFTTLEQLSEESEVVAREEAAEESGAESVSCGGGGGASIDRNAPILSDLTHQVDNRNVTIDWRTNEDGISILNYGVDELEENSVTDPITLIKRTKNHTIAIEGLSPGLTYKYQAITVDASGNVGRSKEGTFEVGDIDLIGDDTDGDTGDDTDSPLQDESFVSTVDKVKEYFDTIYSEVSLSTFKDEANALINSIANIVPPPVISGEPVLTISPNTVIIEWTTDDEANALVSYASEDYYLANDAYEHTVGDPNLYLAGVHRVAITGLEPETIYHYKVKSQNDIGSTAQSRDFTFTTIAELAEIENYSTEIVSPEEVIFKWVTTVPTDTNVRYIPYRDGQLDIDSARNKSNEVLTTIHNISVEDLESGVLYQVELSGQTESGNTISQTISSFATSDDNLAPIIRQVKTDAALSLGKETKVQAIISWYTNEPSTSRVYYEQGAGRSDEELTQSSPIDENYARHHVVVITNFNPGSIYRFQVESTDSEGNSSRSRTYTILTPKQQESVFQVIMRNVEDTFGWLEAFR